MFRHSRGGRGWNGLGIRSAVREVMRDLSNNQFMVRMENHIRMVIREELERLIQPMVQTQRSSSNLMETSNPETTLQLRFINSLPQAIFTGSRIESEDGSPITLELIDSNTKTRITSGPFSSSKIEILPLDGDFTREDWDDEQFKSNVLREREGRRPLLTGDLTLALNEGLGVIHGNAVFTDNSSWTRSRSFRLGARVSRTMCRGSRIKEARSEPFVCKDHRGESYRKHYPPFPDDEVWRLAKISRDGVFHSRLTKFGIHTVKDFLRFYTIDPARLRHILGNGGGVSNRAWEAITSHSLQCVLDENEYYLYNDTAHGACLLFNSVYKVVAVSFEDFGFQHIDQLDFRQKLILDALKLEAYKNTESLNRVNGHNFKNPSKPLPSARDEPLSLPNPGLHQIDLDITHQDQHESLINFNNNFHTTSYSCEMVNTHQFQVMNGGNSFQVFSPALRNSFRMGDFIPVTACLGESSSSGSQEKTIPTGQFETEDTTRHWFPTDWSSGSASWPQTDGLYLSCNNEPEIIRVFSSFDVNILRNERSRARWCKIRAALKLRSVWRYAAARKRARLLYRDY